MQVPISTGANMDTSCQEFTYAAPDLFQAVEELADDRLARNEDEHAIGHPFLVEHGLVTGLKWIAPEVVQLWCTQLDERIPVSEQTTVFLRRDRCSAPGIP